MVRQNNQQRLVSTQTFAINACRTSDIPLPGIPMLKVPLSVMQEPLSLYNVDICSGACSPFASDPFQLR